MQFSIKSYEFKAPDDTKSVRRYLASGAIKGIGEKMAERIVKEFGDDTFRIMEEEPERLAEIKGISLTKAMDIAAQLVDKRDMRKAMMFLQDYGISMGIAGKIYSRYGQEIYTIIKQNPYRLADDIDGIGLKRPMKLRQRPALKWIRISESAVGFVCADTGGRTGTHLSAVDRIRAGGHSTVVNRYS